MFCLLFNFLFSPANCSVYRLSKLAETYLMILLIPVKDKKFFLIVNSEKMEPYGFRDSRVE